MIHQTVHAPLHHDLSKAIWFVFACLVLCKGAGADWSFLKLQHLGSSLQAILRNAVSLLELCTSGTMASVHCLHACAGGLQMGCGWLLLCC